MKTNMTKEQLQKKRNDDAVVYKVMIALVLLCVALLGLRSLRDFYATMNGFSALYYKTPAIMIAGLVVAAAAGAVGLMVRKPACREVMPWIVVLGLMVSVTAWNMRLSGADDFDFLYFLCCAILVQYIIFQLYRWEFFLFSLSAVTAGGVFFSFSRGVYWTQKTVALVIILALVVVCSSLAVAMASRNKGRLTIGKNRIVLLSAKSLPVLFYIANALWVVCTAAIPFLGGLFAYYCMFAAIAVEFVAAVYYTFQLN